MLHEIALLDQLVADWLQAHNHGGVTGAMELVSRWQRPLVMWSMTMVIAAVLLWHRDREALWILLLATPLGSALNHLLKHTIRHARPGSMEVVSETDFGFRAVMSLRPR